MGDPGLSLKCATLIAAWRLLGARMGSDPLLGSSNGSDPIHSLPEEAVDAVEELALTAGMRSRRVILDAKWWKQAAEPVHRQGARVDPAAHGLGGHLQAQGNVDDGELALGPAGRDGHDVRALDEVTPTRGECCPVSRHDLGEPRGKLSRTVLRTDPDGSALARKRMRWQCSTQDAC